MDDRLPLRMTRPGRFKRWPELEAAMQRHGFEPQQPFDFADGKATYHAMQIDEPCYADIWIEVQDDAKAAPLIAELTALGFEVELETGETSPTTASVQ